MSQIKTLNGVQYTLPQLNDTNWGANTGNVLTQYIAAIADCTLQLTGGAFTLTADADFGANFGLKALYLKSETANISTSGVLRLASTDTIGWRNNANGANVSLSKDTSDNLLWSGTKVIISGAIVNADIASAAAIAVNKLAALTVSRAVASDSSGFITPSTTTAAELAFVSGVTSAIQTQINSVVTTANGALQTTGGTMTGPIVYANGTAVTPAMRNAANSGIYFATNLIGFAVNGANKWTMDSNGALFGNGIVNAGDGAVGTPSLSFNSDATTGFYRNSAGVVSYAGSGVQSLEFLPIASSDDAEQVPFEWFGGGNHNAGGIVKYTSTGVTTSAKKIGRVDFDGGMLLVLGTDGTNQFMDLILGLDVTTTAPTVVGSTTKGTPAARTYTAANGQVKVTMGSGTYTISSTTFGLNFR